MDNRLLKVKLDDYIIKAIDEEGKELLRLAMTIEGHEILLRFPTYGMWDLYVNDLAQLLILLAKTTDDIQIPDFEKIDDTYFGKWAVLVSYALKYKQCSELVEKIFFTYLRPEIPKLIIPDNINKDDYTKEWLKNNMSIISLFMMFTSILQVEEWLKKKSIQILKNLWGVSNQTGQQSTVGLQPSVTPTSVLPPVGQPYTFT